MEFHQRVFLIGIVSILLVQYASNVEGRHHIRTSRKHRSDSADNADSPVYAPSPDSPDCPPPDAPPDPISPPAPDPGNSTTECIFNVMDFGAVGDGSTDDTAAFRAAWKEACQVESSVLLAPPDYVFLITSTIFSGPCKPGLIFQVRQQ